ncbi:hypothetical protein WA026_015670 [Henosepilachna vigintioctopunctata]|uniref:Uncharacterized protein n=1 Tax=Henosepilachna vigintioctopunctata TaxID=420089 RepID=A0AAW1V073_9CUCU
MNQFTRGILHAPKQDKELENMLEYNAVSTRNDFRIFHQNIRSINKNLDMLKIYLSQVNDPFDCIVLTESWRVDGFDLLQMKDYDLLYNKSELNRADGVVVFINANLEYSYEIIDIGRCKAIEIKIVEGLSTLVVTAV